MRILTFTFLVAFVQVAFSKSKQVTVEGQLTNFAYYDSITISEFTYDNPFSKTVKLSDKGKFEISFGLEYPNYFRLGLDDKNHLMLILSPGDEVQVMANAEDLQMDFTVKGSDQTKLFYNATKQFDVFAQLRDSLAMVFKLQNEQVSNAETEYVRGFIEKNKTSLSSLLLIDKLDKDKYMNVYVSLDSSLMANYPSNKIVQDFHKDVQKITSQRIGFPIAEIELANAKGEIVKLSSLKGKVVLIDFWATWCMPCKAEIPNFKNAYKKYKEQGFEIYSISIDRDKNRWLAEEKTLPWINVYDDGGQYAKMFNVNSIPFTMLIDRDGKIVRKNIRGQELEDSLSKLLE